MVVMRLLVVLKGLAIAKQIRLELSIDENLPPFLLTDEGRLSQVLINLISNSIKFTESGSVAVSIQYNYDVGSIPEDKRRAVP
jgi:signal transduction histidine kinase